MTPVLAEFIGTTFLILLGNGVVANVVLKGTKGNNSGWIVITTGWALAVYVGVVFAAPYSGAHLNPAVTIGLALAGQFAWNRVAGFILAQVGGAMLGSFLVWLMYKDHFDNTEDVSLKLIVFSTKPAIKNPVMNVLSEAIGTFVLMFIIFYFTNAEIVKDKTPIGLGSLGAIPVAFLVWAIGLSLGGTTGYAISPSRDLGPRIMHAILPIKGKGSSDWGYAWVPIVGPIIGTTLAAGLYLLIK
ncbi:MAG TPA: MIP/aquaporin family protein [Hanamia sp.]|nr:MIP/aquaporin family protein [Hanamia sp.]